MYLTPFEAMWLLVNLPSSAPFHPCQEWMKMRNRMHARLEDFIDTHTQPEEAQKMLITEDELLVFPDCACSDPDYQA